MSDLDPHGDYYIRVTARRAETGEPVEVTVSPAGPALTYNEHWTAPSPWWKRVLRRALRGGAK